MIKMKGCRVTMVVTVIVVVGGDTMVDDTKPWLFPRRHQFKSTPWVTKILTNDGFFRMIDLILLSFSDF